MKRPVPLWLCVLSLILSPAGHSNSTPLVQEVRNEAGIMTIEPISFYFHETFAGCPVACHGEECMPCRGGNKGDRKVPLIRIGPCSAM